MKEVLRILTLIDTLRNEGNAFVKECNCNNAFIRYTSAINYCDNHSKMGSICYSNRAFCLIKMGKTTEALEDCILAVSLDDKNIKAETTKKKHDGY